MDRTNDDRAAMTHPSMSDPMTLLAAGVPLSLLFDLVVFDASSSRDLAQVERADTGWVHHAA